MNEITLKTSRLILRELEFNDIDNVHILHSLPETDEFNTMGIPKSREVTEKLVSGWTEIQKQEF